MKPRGQSLATTLALVSAFAGLLWMTIIWFVFGKTAGLVTLPIATVACFLGLCIPAGGSAPTAPGAKNLNDPHPPQPTRNPSPAQRKRSA